jgi:hypothetical protein
MSTQNDLVKNEAEVKNAGFEVKVLTIAEVNSLRLAGKFDSSASYQRSFKSAWLKDSYRCAVLDSIMRGFSIGAIYCVSRAGGVLELMDGKQRLNFLGLTLDSIAGFSSMEDSNLNKVFNEWKEADKKQFLDYKIAFVVFAGLDDSDRRLQFERLNAGVKLTKIESRRGLILSVVDLEAVKEASKIILSVLPDIAGRQASYDTAEEIVLQSLSFLAGKNADFKGYEVIDSLKALKLADVKKSAEVVKSRAEAIAELMTSGDEDQNGLVKWIGKKTVLNSLLCVPVDAEGVYNFVSFSSFKKTAEYKEAGQDQIDFKEASASASASSVNVLKRIEILGKVQAGKASKNIEKELKEKAVKKAEGFKLGSSKAEAFTIDSKTLKQFEGVWGAEASAVNIEKVYDYVMKAEGKIKTVLGRIEKSGVKSFGFQDKNGKFSTIPLSELLAVKAEAEAVKAEAGKVNQSVVNIR